MMMTSFLNDNSTHRSLKLAQEEADRRRSCEETYTEPIMTTSVKTLTRVTNFMSEFNKLPEMYETEFKDKHLQEYKSDLLPLYRKLVPSELSHKTFIQRYYYRCCDLSRIQDELDDEEISRQKQRKQQLIEQEKKEDDDDDDNDNDKQQKEQEQPEESNNNNSNHAHPHLRKFQSSQPLQHFGSVVRWKGVSDEDPTRRPAWECSEGASNSLNGAALPPPPIQRSSTVDYVPPNSIISENDGTNDDTNDDTDGDVKANSNTNGVLSDRFTMFRQQQQQQSQQQQQLQQQKPLPKVSAVKPVLKYTKPATDNQNGEGQQEKEESTTGTTTPSPRRSWNDWIKRNSITQTNDRVIPKPERQASDAIPYVESIKSGDDDDDEDHPPTRPSSSSSSSTVATIKNQWEHHDVKDQYSAGGVGQQQIGVDDINETSKLQQQTETEPELMPTPLRRAGSISSRYEQAVATASTTAYSHAKTVPSSTSITKEKMPADLPANVSVTFNSTETGSKVSAAIPTTTTTATATKKNDDGYTATTTTSPAGRPSLGDPNVAPADRSSARDLIKRMEAFAQERRDNKPAAGPPVTRHNFAITRGRMPRRRSESSATASSSFTTTSSTNQSPAIPTTTTTTTTAPATTATATVGGRASLRPFRSSSFSYRNRGVSPARNDLKPAVAASVIATRTEEATTTISTSTTNDDNQSSDLSNCEPPRTAEPIYVGSVRSRVQSWRDRSVSVERRGGDSSVGRRPAGRETSVERRTRGASLEPTNNRRSWMTNGRQSSRSTGINDSQRSLLEMKSSSYHVGTTTTTAATATMSVNDNQASFSSLLFNDSTTSFVPKYGNAETMMIIKPDPLAVKCVVRANRRRNLDETYTQPLEDEMNEEPEVRDYLRTFRLGDFEDEAMLDLAKFPETLGLHFEKYVLSGKVGEQQFWCRYFFRCVSFTTWCQIYEYNIFCQIVFFPHTCACWFV
jgi:hypothetical protein